MAYREDFKVNTDLWNSEFRIPLSSDIFLERLRTTMRREDPEYMMLEYLMTVQSPDVKKYLPGMSVSNLEETRNILALMITAEKRKEYFCFCIGRSGIRKGSMCIGFIKCICPSHHPQPLLKDWSIEFWINEANEGHNIMTCALQHVLKFLGEYEIDTVEADTHPDNIGSARVLEKCGFRIVASFDKPRSGRFNRYSVRLPYHPLRPEH
jgi:RimJ/RimL family protein N-acetyltransferase